MTDAASLTVSIVAAVISLGSAVAAFAALRAFPRPYLMFRTRMDKPLDEEHPTLIVQILNLGKSSAHDLRLVLRNSADGEFEILQGHYNELSAGFSWDERISLVTGTAHRGWTRDEYGQFHAPAGDSRDMLWELELTWRQAPTMNRLRSKSLRVRTYEGNSSFAREKFYFRRWSSSVWAWIRSPFGKLPDVPPLDRPDKRTRKSIKGVPDS